MPDPTLQLYRLLPDSLAVDYEPTSDGATGRHAYQRSADVSPIAESHRGPQYGAVESWLVDDLDAAETIRSRFAGDGSLLMVTRRHVVLNGAPLTGVDAGMGIKMVVGMCRAEGMAVDTFQQHWLNEHAAITLDAPGTSRYEVALPVVDEYCEGQLLFDGFAELWWRSQDDLDAYLTSPAMEQVGADMELFVSSSRPLFSVYSTSGERWL